MIRYIWIVWLLYPKEHRRYSAAFSSHEEALKYAVPTTSFAVEVTRERVYESADDVL